MNTHGTARPLLICDGDDTLWLTMPLYERAKKAFALAVSDVSRSDESAIELLDDIDDRNVSHYGYSPVRFPLSLIQAYKALCQHRCAVPDPEVEDILHAIGAAVFIAPAEVALDAEHMLRRVRPHATLALVTKGDPTIQASRLEHSGLRQYFDWTAVVADKSSDQFTAMLAEHGAKATDAWSIGNSIRSDIAPALRIGMSAVWIPNASWRHEVEPLPDSHRLFICESLSVAADVILQELT